MSRFYTTKQVIERLGVSRSTLWRIQRNLDFPKPIRLTLNKSVFLVDEVEAWIDGRLSS